ncbi:MAG: hypothetical protein NZT61_04810 [Deltaproteobacteria bacterium]|nr:hypothetical protein [Deltaproteobacteria bacterium]
MKSWFVSKFLLLCVILNLGFLNGQDFSSLKCQDRVIDMFVGDCLNFKLPAYCDKLEIEELGFDDLCLFFCGFCPEPRLRLLAEITAGIAS